jgi:MSHA biogenesis protein MshO
MRQQGFTLVEVVVAVAIASVVVIFAAMFTLAPLEAYGQQSRRAAMVGDAEAAWPGMLPDLRRALPNSLRTLRNGNFVVVEMLNVRGVSRYMTPLGGSFTAAGTPAGVFSNVPASLAGDPSYYLSVNNRGQAPHDAYALTGSITANRPQISFITAANGEATVTVSPAPATITTASARRRVYLVDMPVTFLCDETQGTLRRYSGYAITANQAARSAPNQFAGASNRLIASGLTSCNFSVSPRNSDQPQTFAARLTTVRNGETVTLLHSARAEYAP